LSFEAAEYVLGKHQDWTIAQVAREIGCSRQYLSQCKEIQRLDKARIYDRRKVDGYYDAETGTIETWKYNRDIRS
jgi:hypothetical protein